MTTTKVIRYRTKPEQADENERLIRDVFAELAEQDPDGLHYADVPSRRRRELRARRRPRRRGEPADVVARPSRRSRPVSASAVPRDPSPPTPRWSGPTGSWRRCRPVADSRVRLGGRSLAVTSRRLCEASAARQRRSRRDTSYPRTALRDVWITAHKSAVEGKMNE